METGPREYIEEQGNTFSPEALIADYRMTYMSRQASLTGRKEVLTGKAKFGIFGDGKELPQVAMAHAFQPGDIRSGYYRDQTFIFATGMGDIKAFFAQLFANPDVKADPFSAGRQMNAHFASRTLNEDGSWKNLLEEPHSAADASPTASQMPRLAGLVQASRLYRILPGLKGFTQFSNKGNEVIFGTIGNASSAEGSFWETINAIGVIQGPLVMSIWDDGYGISVPNEFQLTRSLSEMLSGFRRDENGRGYELMKVSAWDYPALMETYKKAADIARYEHVPVIIHVVDVTQPQGHSTSGSHERYKSDERLQWEKDFDCVSRFREWIITRGHATAEEMDAWEKEDRKEVRRLKNEAWSEYQAPILQKREELRSFFASLVAAGVVGIQEIDTALARNQEPKRRDLMTAAHDALFLARTQSDLPITQELISWREALGEVGKGMYSTHLYSEDADSALLVEEVKPRYSDDPEILSGFEILNRNFDHIFETNPRVIAFGEDVGHLGDVNQGFAGLQAKHGEYRIMDTGIRETTIIGQALGLAMRGLRPIAEIQYLDYFLYGLQTMSDDMATLRYRTFGGQKAPAIIRTRGHRLEGIWHAGSPMGMLTHALRGIYLCVPRDMTRAAGMYNTLLEAEEPAVIIEVLNGYRLKEAVPDNLTEMKVPMGVPEILREGSDVTIVTYGALCRMAMSAAEKLDQCGVSVEIIDIQTLLPFDRHHRIVESLKKTNRILFLDEDVPGGASAYMMQEVLEKQGGYFHLDSEPRTLCSQAHRPAYADDGDYWSKPQVEDIFRTVYELMSEVDPARYPGFF